MNACIGVIGLLRTLNRMTFAIPRAAAASLVGLLLLCGCAVSVADSEGHPRAVETLAATGGAAALSLADLTPRVDEAFNDRPGHDCVLQPEEVEPKVCEFGDTASDFVVVLVGDSKLHQWRPALEAIATEQGWRLVEIVKSACAFTAAMTVYEDSAWTECHDWGQKTLDVVLEMEPDLVIVSQRRSAAMPGDDPAITTAESMVDGLVTYWSRLTRAGIQVVALLDNPAPTGHVPKCLE